MYRNLREAGEGVAASLYGEDVKVSELQFLFSLTELYRMKKEFSKIDVPNIFDDIEVGKFFFHLIHLLYPLTENYFCLFLSDIDQVAAELEQEIDRLMPEPDSDDFNKFLAMKAYSLNLRSHDTVAGGKCLIPPARPEYLEKTVKLLERIKLEPVAVYFYVDALNILGTCYLFKEPQKSVKYLLKAEKTYEDFKAKVTDVKEAMTPYQIFDVPREIQTFWCLMTAHHYTSVFLYSAYSGLNNDPMKLKYVVPSIRGKISIDLSSHKGTYIIKNIMADMFDEILFLIRKWHFAQVNHLLAGFMNNLVEYRRALPEEQRHEMNFSQALVSLAYATWAHEVLRYSFAYLNGKYDDDIEPYYLYHEFTGLKTPGFKVYHNQFPCHRIKSRKQMKNYIKRGKAWCKRAIDLFECCCQYSIYAGDLMNKLNLLENDVQYFEGMDD